MIRDAQREARGRAREELGRARELDREVLDVAPRDDARHDERAEKERHEDVEAVVSRVRRRNRDDERQEDEPEPEVRDTHEDPRVEELPEARAERHGPRLRGARRSRRGAAGSRRAHAGPPPPSHAPGCDARTRCASDGDRDALDVVGRRVRPARDERAGLDGAEEALRAARGHAEEEVLARTRPRDDRHDVVHELVRDRDALRRVLRGLELVERDRGRELREDAVGAAREEEAALLVGRRIAERDPHQEAVELRLGKRVGPEVLDRVLRREDEERLGKRLA